MNPRAWHALAAAGLLAAAVRLAGCAGRSEILSHLPPLLPARTLTLHTFFADTADGWTLALHRYANPQALRRYPPVILCHGLGYNSNFWDLDADHNLADYLHSRGLDVWLLDLRGVGRSTRPGWTILRTAPLAGATLSQYRFDRFDWTIDDHILLDLPAAIDLVKRETGHPRVMFVGHSMGGMIAYGYLQRTDRQDLCRLVTLGSPVTIDDPPNQALRDIPRLTPILASINNRFPSLLSAVSGALVKTPWDLLFYNDANVDRSVVVSLYRKAAEDLAPGQVRQFIRMLEGRQFVSADGQFNYAQQLGRVQAPVLVIGGMADNLASVEAVRYAYHRLGSSQKQLRIFQRINGDAADYGHDDLILGRRAAQEVFPVIADWLLAHPPSTQPAPRREGEG